MSEQRDPGRDQALPVATNGPFIHELVIEDVRERMTFGSSKYGTALQSHNGRDMLRDAYEEAIDLAVYLRGLIEERSN